MIYVTLIFIKITACVVYTRGPGCIGFLPVKVYMYEENLIYDVYQMFVLLTDILQHHLKETHWQHADKAEWH